MYAFLNLLTDFYILIQTQLGLSFLNEITEGWTRLMTNDGERNPLMTFLVLLVVYNIIHRPSKYKFRLFWAPTWVQFAIRQLIVFSILTNGGLLVSLLAVTFVGAFAYFLLFSGYSGTAAGGGPLAAFFNT